MIENKKLQRIHEEACIRTSEALAKLIGRQAIVDITNPKLKKVKELTLPINSGEAIAAVCLPIGGEVKGAGLLLFSQETAFSLSELLIKRVPGTTGELTELGKSALEELGNIVCGTYFTTLSNRAGNKMIERIPQFTFDKLPVILEQAVTKFTEKIEDVLAIGADFNFTVPTYKGHLFKSYFLVLFEIRQLEAISSSLQEVMA